MSCGTFDFSRNCSACWIVGESVLILALFRIHASNVVQADGLQAFIAKIALHLQRFFVHFQRLVVVATVIVEIAQVDQSIAQAALVADFTPNLQSLLEVGQSIFGFAERSLSRSHLVQAEGKATLLTDARQIASASCSLRRLSSGLLNIRKPQP